MKPREHLTNDELYERCADLETALVTATAAVRDLVNGWPVRELGASPEQIMATLDMLVPNHEVMPL